MVTLNDPTSKHNFPTLVSSVRMLSRVPQLQDHITPTMAAESTPKTPNIDLYTTQTPNGIKISILLEELGFVEQRPGCFTRG